MKKFINSILNKFNNLSESINNIETTPLSKNPKTILLKIVDTILKLF